MRKTGWAYKIIIFQFLACLLLPFDISAQMSRSAIDITTAHFSLSSATPTASPSSPDPAPAAPTPPANANLVNLFLHLDKSIYQPQETIWFTGYVLNRDADLMSRQNTLYVILIDPVRRTPVLKQRFLIKNGFGKGFLTLPDSIAAGNYWLVGFTNALLETGDQPLFREWITVRSGSSPFRINTATLEPFGDSIAVRYKISTSYKGLASGGKFAWTLYDSSNAIASGEKLIDASGEVLVPIGSKQDAGKYREIAATVTRDKFSKQFIHPIETGRQQAKEITSKENGETSAAKVTISMDTTEHHRRSKVTLHIRISDKADQPVPGVFSLAVAASPKMKLEPASSILHYENPPDRIALPSILHQLAGDMPDSGYVLQDQNKPKRPVTLALMGNSFTSFQTDSSGGFTLPFSALVTPMGAVNYISVADRSPERYTIVVLSRVDTFAEQLAKIHYPVPAGWAIVQETLEPDTTTATQILQTATVKAKSTAEYNALTGEYNSKHCDQDYVCPRHGPAGSPLLLNCSCGREGKAKPMEGGLYGYLPDYRPCYFGCGVLAVVYHCATPPAPAFMTALHPILYTKTFSPPVDSKQEPLGSGIQSTIYWDHSLVTDKNGELTISFYTNDLTGNFTCFLQGVSAQGLIQGLASYVVTE